MQKLLIFLFSPFLLVAQNTIKIDGFFDDWNTDMSTYIDDSFDSEGIELLEFSVCHDNEYLYVKIKLDTEIDLTDEYLNPSKLMVNIDADNNPSTGYYTNSIGSEYGINFFDKFIFDDTNFPIVDTLSLYDLNVIPLPTYTSNEFEIAINRSMFSETIAISVKLNLSVILVVLNIAISVILNILIIFVTILQFLLFLSNLTIWVMLGSITVCVGKIGFGGSTKS